MRASRLVELTLLLQTRGASTAETLADELGVSVRTIHRDVESLRAAGVPIAGERGPAGGYRLPGGYRTRLTGLTPAEVDALFAGGAAGGIGLGPVLADAQLKLLAALPPALRARADRAAQLFHTEPEGWFRPSTPPRHLDVVAAALWRGRRLELTYNGRDRIVDPLGIVLKGGAWYLVAGTPRGERTFRIARITAAAEREDAVSRPADFDLATHWAAWREEFEAGFPLTSVRVRVEPAALDALRRGADPRGRDQLPAALETPAALDVPYESLEIATTELRKLGAGVEVLAPPELRERFAADARALAARYA